jgi:hypothetical protein
MKRSFWTALSFSMLLAAPIFPAEGAISSKNLASSYDPQTECLGIKMMIPPLVVFERIRPGMDMEEASKIVSLFAREEDQITVSLGEDGENNHAIIWKWFTPYDETRKTGETATVKIFIMDFKVSMIEIEHIILNNENIERRSREKSTFQFIANRANKK